MSASGIDFNELLDDEDVDDIFTLEEEIASGSFGTVYKGTHLPTGREMAIKIITPDDDEIPEDLMIEIAVLKKCSHENIVEYFGGYRKGDEIFIAMEVCDGSVRDIFDYTDDPLLEEEIALIMLESLKGIKYMHDNNMIHRDIKAANILVTPDGAVKLVDFGVSSLNAAKAKTFVGTPFWMSPELIDSKNGMSTYGKKVDIWALGITCIELAETVPPLSYINPMRALFQIPARDSPQLEKQEEWSPNFHDFIAKCLEKNPKKRPDADQLLQHPFVRDCDKDPSILVRMVERKQALEEACDYSDSDEEDSEEEEDPYLPKQVEKPPAPINPFAQQTPAVTPQSPKPQFVRGSSASPLAPKTVSPLAEGNPNSNLPPKPTAPAGLVQRSKSSQPEDLQHSSTPQSSEPRATLPSQQQNVTSRPTARSTLKRPPTTRRSTKKGNEGLRAVNRKILKQQMQELRNIQAKLQKRIDKQGKGHQREKDQIMDQYKRQLDQLSRNSETHKKNLEKAQKQEQDGLSKSQLKDQRALQRQYDNDLKQLQKQQKDNNKISLKTHTLNQKNLTKEQKAQRSQAKKMLSKTELKALDKEHRVQLQLNTTLHNHNLARAACLQELKLEWDHQLALDTQKTEELEQTHQQEQEMLKQLLAAEFEELEQSYNLRVEVQQKYQPLERRLLIERNELEQQNFAQQLQVEKQQQIQLLLADQRKQKKEHNANKKKVQKESMDQQKVLRSSGRAKSEVKEKIQQEKESLNRRVKDLDLVHEQELASQREIEESQLEAFQERQRQQLREKHDKSVEQLDELHTTQRSDIHHEEMEARGSLLDDHHCKEIELMNKQFKEQTDLIDTQHHQKLFLMRTQQKKINELVDHQRQECLSFIDANIDKLPHSAEPKFKETINTEFDEVVAQQSKVNQHAQRELSELMEKEQETLKLKQQLYCEEMVARHEKETKELEILDQAYASVLQTSTF